MTNKKLKLKRKEMLITKLFWNPALCLELESQKPKHTSSFWIQVWNSLLDLDCNYCSFKDWDNLDMAYGTFTFWYKYSVCHEKNMGLSPPELQGILFCSFKILCWVCPMTTPYEIHKQKLVDKNLWWFPGRGLLQWLDYGTILP